MIAHFLDEARVDWHDAVLHYEAQREGLGVEFVQAVREGVRAISESPLTWPTYTRSTRVYRLDRFPCRIVYAVERDGAVVITVMHTKRDDAYWQRRWRGPSA